MKNHLLLLIVLFVLGSCSKDFEKIAIDSDIIVSAKDESNVILLESKTEKLYGHSGHSVIFSQRRKGNEFFIHFKKVKSYHTGFTVLSPAQSSIELGELMDGEYRLTFKLNKKETIGYLTKMDSTLSFHIMPGGNVKL